ncbi:hypothetical protein HH1059_20460 [Halorhodospira halochloris]|uniref:CRISPR-associated protein Csx16 n=1 Tax=Halorhodospira halochloris TaxID=1052 RepID=A0A110B7C4_HALHR|nr:CRISPR-associated protein Csx16 [Halorhodospira halochloris]MBK1651904.1 CRISPR-associated protein Csx16 [Halorhodospira halochloris]BAU58753.2 hypothetical protein HH1059_20460 [Halorhodospira halochloris]
MTTWFVSRHPGAAAWAERQGIEVDRFVEHLDWAAVERGDAVIGTLPVHIAAMICQRGAAYWHLSLELPLDMRGKELSEDDMELAGARIERFHVEKK